MVKVKSPMRGSLCRAIQIDGFNHYANSKRVRLTFYNLQLAMPEVQDSDAIL
jgi:hypothetical protein